MRTKVFDFQEYREYLSKALPVKGPERGRRTRLADLLGCQTGFVSLVLKKKAHFSFEHAIKISQFLQHDAEEEDFFLLLVHLGRAGSKDLESYYRQKIKAIQEHRREVKTRIQIQSELRESDKLVYYSQWYFTAVHMCLMIPALQTPRAISDYLQVPMPVVSETLSFLVQSGLAVQEGSRFVAGFSRIHLPAGSPLLAKHHTNWRMKAIQSLEYSRRTDLHFSSVISASADAMEEIRVLLLKSIQDMEPIIRKAQDEQVSVVGIDLFSWGQPS